MNPEFLHITAFATLLFSLYACGGSDAKNASEGNKNSTGTGEKAGTKPSGKSLVDGAAAPEGYTFSQQNFEGAGTIQMPAGGDWQRDGKTLYNEKLDLTIILNSQADDMRDMQEEYVQSYIDNNFRDALNFKLVSRESGTINGTTASRILGSFNNGKEYSTLDYLFFAEGKSSILQARAANQHEDLLKRMVDYMAQSFRKKIALHFQSPILKRFNSITFYPDKK